MRAISAAPRNDLRPPLDDEGSTAILHRPCDVHDAIDEGRLVGIGEPQQHRGDIRGGDHRHQFGCECRRVGDRRRHKIKAGSGPWLGLFWSRCHDGAMVAQSDENRANAIWPRWRL
jgi:hypothetical protein